MSKALPQIIIGIPAFNEAGNIGHLLKDIAKQHTTGFHLQEILVNSDASTDDTRKVALQATSLPVIVKDNKKRAGIAGRLNEIIAHAKKQKVAALVLFDADIRIKDTHCIEKLIAPILDENADLTSCKITELEPSNLVDRSLKVSMNIKDSLFTELDNGDNVYTCYGPVRALSSRMIQHLQFPYSIGNDAYTYLYAKKLNLMYKFVRETEVIYKLPTALSDHQNQSQRFLESQKLLAKDFGNDVIEAAYQIPMQLKLRAVLKYFVQEPFLVVAYLTILASMRVKHLSSKGVPDLWDHVSSSKVLHQS